LLKGQTLVIRGATSSFGQAAINMAVNAGAKVIATTRNPSSNASIASPECLSVEVDAEGFGCRRY
jgi:NADPH:quinone reductase-like Zn-dependent oxidoreductase